MPKYLLLLLCLPFFSNPSVSYGQWSQPVIIDTSSNTGYGGGEIALDDSGMIYTAFSPRAESIFVARSFDNGDSWIRYLYAIGADAIRIPQDIAVDHRGYVWLLWGSTTGLDFAPYYLNLSRSVDSGKTFTILFSSQAWQNGFFDEKLAVDAQNNIYMLWDDRHVKVTRFWSGDVSQRTDAELPNDTLSFDSETALAVTPDNVVHCVWGGAYYDSSHELHDYTFYSRSSDSGASFSGRVRIDTTISSPGYDVYHYPSLAIDSTGTIIVSYTKETALNDREIRVARSTNGGQSFEFPVSVSGPDTAIDSRICIDSKGGVDVLWGSEGSGILHYRSTDGGSSFKFFAQFAHLGDRGFKAGMNGFLYATGPNDCGFGFTKASVILSVADGQFLPKAFVLLPNYPNPFNPATTLRFLVPATAAVDLRIYDLMGRQVTVLVSDRLVPGTYSVSWNSSRFASGAYIARFVVGGNLISSRKLLLLR